MKRILLVDDEKLPSAYYRKALEMSGGYQVVWAAGPDAALQAAEQRAFDAFILDIMMPPGSAFKDEDTRDGLRTGVFLVKRLREIYPEVPIIMLSIVKNDEILRECKSVPGVSVLSKLEFHPVKLIEELNARLKP